ncbi:MAG: DUF2752 domain-containing protein [Saprospiraceae bacterium]|uniref:DUF2752 domain-containing protein n=1 Tax=Candidatus Opimibacter skivensis TaxID=2982028 RepID=A0A9D7SUJ3_9BACT|nr:DUF2752 domain-containing protein [Candidatus Opimibacter skivensis]
MYNPEQYFFPLCPFRFLTGWLCPGCGSQRAMHQILHGHIAASMRLNLLFIPGILYVGVGYLSPVLFPKSWPEMRGRYYGLKAAYVSLMVIVIFWVGRNLI